MYMYEEKGNKIKKLLLPVLDHAEPYVRKKKNEKDQEHKKKGKNSFPISTIDPRLPPFPSLYLSRF